MHVVCAWIGNSIPVARKHYLQVTAEHFEQAAMDGENVQSADAALTGVGSALNRKFDPLLTHSDQFAACAREATSKTELGALNKSEAVPACFAAQRGERRTKQEQKQA